MYVFSVKWTTFVKTDVVEVVETNKVITITIINYTIKNSFLDILIAGAFL